MFPWRSREINALWVTLGADRVKILMETQTYPYHPHIWTAINSILSWRSGDIVVGKLRRGKKGVDSISHWADFGQLTLFYTYFGRYTTLLTFPPPTSSRFESDLWKMNPIGNYFIAKILPYLFHSHSLGLNITFCFLQ